LHAGAEGARKDAFYEALDTGFEVAQNADRELLGSVGGRRFIGRIPPVGAIRSN
jgi:hypothetical protein